VTIVQSISNVLYVTATNVPVPQDELSGADIKAVCTEAGLLALRERRMRVTQVCAGVADALLLLPTLAVVNLHSTDMKYTLMCQCRLTSARQRRRCCTRRRRVCQKGSICSEHSAGR
jgi:SpoVK/Ycf46/Vps4 family AAA+-type ATPase